MSPEIEERANEIYRCEQIVQRYRNDPDQEVKDYCTSQGDRANQHEGRAGASAAAPAQPEARFSSAAARRRSMRSTTICRRPPASIMIDVAGQVFDRYKEAPVRAETTLAEKFLKAGNLRAVTSAIDPLGLVQVSGGTPQINTGA